MDIHQNKHQHLLQQEYDTKSISLDALYCEEREEQWEEEDEEDEEEEEKDFEGKKSRLSLLLLPRPLLEQDLFWEDEELVSLFTKEENTQIRFHVLEADSSLLSARARVVDWMLRVHVHYGFSNLTAILAINYLDRFLSGLDFQKDKPWMIQLAAVTCLSLAAKVEETQIPLLLDFQVEETEYVFEAKTIQKMELLVLSTLQWRMNPVTPISFLDHVVRRLGLKTDLHWEFLRQCQDLLVSVVADSRSVRYLPSVLATAAMLHVIPRQAESGIAVEYQNQLLDVLKISKEKVNDCYQLIAQLSNSWLHESRAQSHKRKYEWEQQKSDGPSCVTDASSLSLDFSNDSWVAGDDGSSDGSASSSSPSAMSFFKKRRVGEEQQMSMPTYLNGGRVFVDPIGRPC